MSTSFHTLLDRIGRTDDTVRLATVHGDKFTPFTGSRDTVATFLAENPHRHLWFEINPAPVGPNHRSAERDIYRLTALYVDVDYKGGGMGSPEAAWQLVDDLTAALGVPPTAVVHTGNGLQPYWPVSDGKINEDSRELVATVLARWKEMCRTFARAAGGDVDSVFDLARIFRVPGSFNMKDPANPVEVTVDFPDGSDSFTLEELQGIFDDYQIVAQPREISTDVVSPMADWDWAAEDCQHVRLVRKEWAEANPGARHPWLLAQAARLHGMIRYGCVTEATFNEMRVELDHRFRALLALEHTPRTVGVNEIASAYRWGAQQATLWSKEKLIDEMRSHAHDSFLDQLIRGVTTIQRGPIGSAAPQAGDASVIDLFTKRPIGTPTPPGTGGDATFGNLALVSETSLQRLANVAHTDTGNSELYAQDVAGRFCHVADVGWHYWDGQRWALDVQGLHREAYKDLFTTKVMGTIDTSEIAWLTSSLNASRMNAALKLAETIPSISVNPVTMDANMRELVTPAGIVNLFTGEFRDANPMVDRHTKMTPVAPDFTERPEQFLRLLNWALLGDQELVGYFQRLFGLALIGELRQQIFPTLIGAGSNGKSTILDILLDVLGPYARKMPPSFLVQTKGSQIPEALASLKGVRVAVASEVPAKAVFDEELVKSISGDKTISARRLFENSEPFLNTTTLFGAFNHYPEVVAGGTSWWRRQRIIKMIAYMPDEQADTTLGQRIVEQEGGKVLGWMIEGALAYLKHGELPPESVMKTVEEYRKSEDDMTRFVSNEMEFSSGLEVTRQAVYSRYVVFMQQNRLYASLLSEPKFVREFLSAYPQTRVVRDGIEDDTVFGNIILKGGYLAPEIPIAP